ncbi:MAG: tripartite tricarboxylate transporter TctB family protein [Lautropia sp.]|nr:tripartite tricarboxylate transporter TctB family protein [Lautropia sp.]
MPVATRRRRSLAEIAVSLAVLLLGVGVFIIGTSLSGNQRYALVGPDMMPIVVGAGLVLLGSWLLAESFKGGWRNPEPDLPEARGDHAFAGSAFLWVLAGLAVQMALMHTAGFVIAAAGLFLCVARGFGSDRPLRDLVGGLVMGLAIFLFFVRLLNVNLPAGLLKPLLGAAGI